MNPLEILQSRLPWFRVVVIPASEQRGAVVALVLDGVYWAPGYAENAAAIMAEMLGVPLGWPTNAEQADDDERRVMKSELGALLAKAVQEVKP